MVLQKLTKAEKGIMKMKDKRVKSLTEILQGVHIIKLFAWEDQMAERVQDIRAKEVTQLKIYGAHSSPPSSSRFLCSFLS